MTHLKQSPDQETDVALQAAKQANETGDLIDGTKTTPETDEGQMDATRAAVKRAAEGPWRRMQAAREASNNVYFNPPVISSKIQSE